MDSKTFDQMELAQLMKDGWSWRSSSGGGSGNSGGSISVDSTLTMSGAAADAKVAGDKINALTEEKMNLPQENGAPNHGTAGQFAVSDGMGGIMWKTLVEAEEVSY